MKICPSCGRENLERSEFCKCCAASLNPVAGEDRSLSKRKVVFWALIVSLLGGLMIYAQHKEKQKNITELSQKINTVLALNVNQEALSVLELSQSIITSHYFGSLPAEKREQVLGINKKAQAEHNKLLVSNHLASANNLYKQGDVEKSLAEINKLLEIDPDHKAALKLSKTLIDRKNKIEADRLWNQAKKLVSQKEYYAAKESLMQLKNINPEYPGLERALKRIKWCFLSYYEGDDIKIAIPSIEQQGTTVTFYIWVKNFGDSWHHVNPNNVTIEDAKRVSYSHSTSTYLFSNHLMAIDIQPGSEAGGWIRFDNVRSPIKRIYYKGLFGSTVMRELPDFNGNVKMKVNEIRVF